MSASQWWWVLVQVLWHIRPDHHHVSQIKKTFLKNNFKVKTVAVNYVSHRVLASCSFLFFEYIFWEHVCMHYGAKCKNSICRPHLEIREESYDVMLTAHVFRELITNGLVHKWGWIDFQEVFRSQEESAILGSEKCLATADGRVNYAGSNGGMNEK